MKQKNYKLTHMKRLTYQRNTNGTNQKGVVS